MLKIAVVTGSVRDARINLKIAEWLAEFGREHFAGHTFDVLDIKEFDLPAFNEDLPPIVYQGKYPNENVQKWADAVSSYDGYIFVTPEYNKNITSALKDALDHISPEFNHKAAGIASYGGTLGITANTLLRVTLSNFKLATVQASGTFSGNTDFVDGEFKPAEYHQATVQQMFEDVLLWSEALKTVRNK